MLRRSFLLLQAGGAGFSAVSFGRGLNDPTGTKAAVNPTLPGMGFTPGGPYARFPEHAARMFQGEELRLKRAKAIGEGKDPSLVGTDPDRVTDKFTSEQEALSERFMSRTKKVDEAAEETKGPGDRDDVPDAVARKMRDGRKYSTGPDKVATWYRIFGSVQAIPNKYGAHPDFSIGYKDAPESDTSAEAEEMRKKTGIVYFRKAAEKTTTTNNNNNNNSNDNENDIQNTSNNRNNSSKEGASVNTTTTTKPNSNVEKDAESKAAKRTIDENDFTDDPFLAAFTPSSNANAKRREEMLRSKRMQEEEDKFRATILNGDDPVKINREKYQKLQEEKQSQQQQQQQQQGANSNQSSSSSASSSSSSSFTSDASMGTSGGYNFTRNQVGGSSVAEWREKIKRIRARGEGNIVVRLQGEIGYAHILSQTGIEQDALECLEVGEYVWAKLQEMKRATPQVEGSTHGVVINVAAAMGRAAKSVGKSDVASMWQERLVNSDKSMRENMEFTNKSQMRPENMEPEKMSGARKHKVSANAMWAQLRNPWFGVKWARKTLGEDPEEGSRYTK